MDINVFNNNFEKIAIVDQYRSLMWSRRYYDVGALDLEIEASNETLAIFKKGYYITRNDDDAVYIIKALEIDTQENNDNFLIVGAYECKEILKRRIIWKQVNFSGTAENYIRKLITDSVINPEIAARKINNFNLKTAKGYTETIEQQVTYDNLCDKIIEICTTFGYGWKVTRENGQFYFDLYKGVDRSIDQDVNPRVIFSPDNENIISTKYLTDDSNFKNVALVGGEGEGVERKIRTIGSAEGLERYEMFVDASGISSNTEEGDLVDYYNALISEGKEKLAEQAVTTSFEGEVDTNSYLYKTDYNLGDIVTLRNEYGITANARITEVIETWDDEGYTVEPKFEYFEPIEYEGDVDGALLTENNLMMLTESAAPLLTENSQSVEGVKISQLDPVNELYDGCCFPIVQNGVTKKVTKATLESEILSDADIPTKTSDLQNDSGFITSADVPTKTSQLQNDSNFSSVAANPTLSGGESNLSAIKINGTKYKVPAGGGGGGDIVEFTQAEYDALTPAEKTNGTVYVITDSDQTAVDFGAMLIDDNASVLNKTLSSEK